MAMYLNMMANFVIVQTCIQLVYSVECFTGQGIPIIGQGMSRTECDEGEICSLITQNTAGLQLSVGRCVGPTACRSQDCDDGLLGGIGNGSNDCDIVCCTKPLCTTEDEPTTLPITTTTSNPTTELETTTELNTTIAIVPTTQLETTLAVETTDSITTTEPTTAEPTTIKTTTDPPETVATSTTAQATTKAKTTTTTTTATPTTTTTTTTTQRPRPAVQEEEEEDEEEEEEEEEEDEKEKNAGDSGESIHHSPVVIVASIILLFLQTFVM